MIGIINYGMGNLQSVKNSLDYLHIPNKFVNLSPEMSSCDKLILPGVGAFGLAMKQLSELKFIEPIKEFVASGKPLLGICLGMQLLLDSSEEHGNNAGLGLIRGQVLSFKEKIANLPIPHVGWNDIFFKKESKLLNNVEDGASCYFVHSFYCDLTDKKEVASTTDYGFNFDSSIESGNIFGCQFHPEKSQRVGLAILENFSKIVC
ncbi:MAG: imidazole glycerol phosphate synthase subunit HisH [Candidatus Moranbacteria bacterium]|nr:imidazole glycerol phosphate synthase subunit HisH [Candidatus Moranbacteria bacterium]